MKMKRVMALAFYENSNLENKLVGAACLDSILPVSYLSELRKMRAMMKGAKTTMDESEE